MRANPWILSPNKRYETNNVWLLFNKCIQFERTNERGIFLRIKSHISTEFNWIFIWNDLKAPLTNYQSIVTIILNAWNTIFFYTKSLRTIKNYKCFVCKNAYMLRWNLLWLLAQVQTGKCHVNEKSLISFSKF